MILYNFILFIDTTKSNAVTEVSADEPASTDLSGS